MRYSLAPGGVWSFAPFAETLSVPYYRQRIFFTFWQAILSTAVTLLVGLPTAYAFARYDFPGKTALKAITTVPFVLPTIVVALGFIAFIGPSGLLNRALMDLTGRNDPPINIMNTLWIIILAHVFYNFAIIVRVVSSNWSNLDSRIEESARLLGANRSRVFLHITLPLLLPAIAAASLLVFIFSFTSFGVVLILGSPQLYTLEVAIYQEAITKFNLDTAAVLALLQLAFTFVFFLMYTRLQARTSNAIQWKPAVAGIRKRLTWPRRGFLVANFALVFFLILGPMISLVIRSFQTPEGYSLGNYRALFYNPRESFFYIYPQDAIANSLSFALVTIAIAVPLGTLAAYYLAGHRRTKTKRFFMREGKFPKKRKRNFPKSWSSIILDALIMLPLGISAVTLAFGFIITFSSLRATWWIFVIAHTLIAYPFVLRIVLSVLNGIKPDLREAASALGASPGRVFLHIELPILLRAVLVATTFVFAISMGEFGATLLLWRPEFSTMPIAIFRFLLRPGAGNFGQALAMSTILMLVTAIGFLIIEKIRFRGIGEF